MTSRQKTHLGIAVLVIFLGLVVAFGPSGLFSGDFGRKLAFFSSSPNKDITVDAAFIGSKDAAQILLDSAVASKRIGSREAQTLLQNYTSSRKITRGEFMKMAVEIFRLTTPGKGPTLSDVPKQNAYANDIQLCISNGCLDLEIKPEGYATWTFAQKAAAGLAAR